MTKNQTSRTFTHSFTNCPRCHAALSQTPSFAGPPSSTFLECSSPTCNTFVNTLIPLPHQSSLHRDHHRFTLNTGGYGTGKTTADEHETLKHLLITPNALVVVGAKVSSQYDQTFRKEFDLIIPRSFVAKYSLQKSYVDLINGSRIIYRPFEDPETLRSYNASMFVILEGSEVKYETFVQLQTRLRSLHATLPLTDPNTGDILYNPDNPSIPLLKADWRKGIIETNPDSGWVRDKFALVADNIYYYGSVSDQNIHELSKEKKHPAFSAHIAATDTNKTLPSDFYENIQQGKPNWWVQKFLHGSFAYTEGRVYPNAINPQTIIQPYPIKPSWKRLLAHDWGLVDPSTFVVAALNPEKNKVVIYETYGEQNNSIDDLANVYRNLTKDFPEDPFYSPPRIDPVSGNRRDYDKHSLKDLYQERGIYFADGTKAVEPRVFQLNTYFELYKIEIFETCTELIRELENYKFEDQTLGSMHNKDKPVDKDNHYINALEWIIMCLPPDPQNLFNPAYTPKGLIDIPQDTQTQQPQIPIYYDPLSDDNSDDYELETAYESVDYTKLF